MIRRWPGFPDRTRPDAPDHQAGNYLKMKIFAKARARIREKQTELSRQSDKGYFYAYCSRELAGKGRVLDLGCGVGRFLRLSDGRAIGIDTNQASLREARKNCPRLVCGDLRRLPFADSAFDGINCHHVIEHFNP